MADPGRDDDRLPRWTGARHRRRQLVCLGDSISRAFDNEVTGEPGRSWVDLVALALGGSGDPVPAEGFRGLWRTREWTRTGTWSKASTRDAFDSAPFGDGYLSSGTAVDEVTWHRVAGTTVAAFDLYWLAAPGLGDWQYRVDDGPWCSIGSVAGAAHEARSGAGALMRTFVDQPVASRVQVRGYDGRAPCVASVAGIGVHATWPAPPTGTLLHHLGAGMQLLGHFCRPSQGDPMALLDLLRPELVLVAFSNDVLFDAADAYEASMCALVARVEPYADVVLVSPFEQRPPRRVDDAVTREGSRQIHSDTAAFEAVDEQVQVRGTNIVDQPLTAIRSVESATDASLSAEATGSSVGGALVVGLGREASTQAAYRRVTRRVAESTGCAHLDLYQAWSDSGAAGWNAAWDRGLMFDRYHASLAGHHDIAARILDLLGQPQT